MNITRNVLLSNGHNKKASNFNMRASKTLVINDLRIDIFVNCADGGIRASFLLKTNVYISRLHDNDGRTPFYIAFVRAGRPMRNQNPCTAKYWAAKISLLRTVRWFGLGRHFQSFDF